MNADEVVISAPGGGEARRVPVVGVQCSWELSNIGSFSGFARIEDLRAVGLGGDLNDVWIEWDHPLLGRWGGVITERPMTDGVAEISAEGWAGLLRDHLLDQWDQAPDGSGAGIAARALRSSVNPRGSLAFITIGTVDESGLPVGVTLGGQDMASGVLPQLSEEAGLEWLVDSERVLHLGQRLGRDRSAAVRFVEGVEIVTYTLADSAFATTPQQQLQIASVQAEARLNQGGALPLSTRPRWRDPHIAIAHTVTGRTLETTPMELHVSNVRNAWARCQLGDSVRVVIESAAFSGVFRITGLAFDSVANDLTLAGEATPDVEVA